MLLTPEFKKAENEMEGKAVIESGSNENGEWVKFSDGTMICTVYKQTILEKTLSAYGSLYQTTQDWIFPVPFINQPTASCGEFLISTGASFGTVMATTKQKAILRVIDAYARTKGIDCIIQATAIGKWK